MKSLELQRMEAQHSGSRWLSWTRENSTMLRNAEKKILSCLKTVYRGWFVDIGPVVGKSDNIWTISLNSDSPQTPLVLLHGLAAGVAFWCQNLDSLAAHRPVYAIDLLGFGRSSRPTFSSDPKEAERQLIDSVEEWRREMKLDQMVLLGHSLGGFLAASYAITYPDRVKHLILADPWGFPEKPPEPPNTKFYLRVIATMLRPLNPLFAVRAAGPFGQLLIEKVRPDLFKKYETVFEPGENVLPQYVYQCNVQNPTGEAAFHCMMHGFGWAKNPMLRRIDQLREDVPITLIYGAKTWMDKSAGPIVKEKRPNSYVQVQVISSAGHHVYADKPAIFNKNVNDVCALADAMGRATPGVATPAADKSAAESETESYEDSRRGDVVTAALDAESDQPKNNDSN